MATIFGPKNCGKLEKSADSVPHSDIIPGELRAFFHPAGIAFGVIISAEPRMVRVIDYAEAQAMIQAAAAPKRRKAEKIK